MRVLPKKTVHSDSFPDIFIFCNSKPSRRNPIGNRAILAFSGQKRGTRIILRILQSLLHFLKAKDVNSYLK